VKFEIKNRWTSEVIFTCELSADVAAQEYRFQLGFAVRKAVEAGANLTRANLTRANLTRANLTDAYLTDANLADAYLTDANLADAYLAGAKNIPESYHTLCRDDLWAVLSASPREVSGLREALISGRVDGSTYEGECACLVGTIANVRGVEHTDLGAVKPNSSRPIERFFMQIKRGDTPENNDSSKRAVEWIDEWLANMRTAFGGKP